MLRLFEYNLDPPSLLDLLSNYMTCIFFGGKIQVYAVFATLQCTLDVRQALSSSD